MPSFNVLWFMEILMICFEEQLLIKYYNIKNLMLIKIQNVMGINQGGLVSTVYNFFDKKSSDP